MKIDTVANELYRKHCQIINANGDIDYTPKLAVYMDYDFYAECKSEIQGRVSAAAVSAAAVSFVYSDILMNYPVWRIPPRYVGGEPVQHQPFIIVNLND